MRARVKSTDMFSAATGAPTFDEIAWSARPISELAAISSDGVHVIRHHGSEAKQTLETRSYGDRRPDALLMSRRSSGVFEARADGVFKASKLSKELCFFFPHGSDANLEFPAMTQALVLHFPAGLLTRHLGAARAKPIEPMLGFRSAGLPGIISMIEKETISPGFGSDLLLDGLYRVVAASLMRASQSVQLPVPGRIVISLVRLRRVLDFIEANLSEKITIQQLADIAGLSMFHFSRVFKGAMHQAPYQYVQVRRLNHAQALIETSNQSIVDIGLSCGFSNQAHFTSAFVKAMGMPPGRYRRNRHHLE